MQSYRRRWNEEGDEETGHPGPPSEGAEVDPFLAGWATGGGHQIQSAAGDGAAVGLPGGAQTAGGGVSTEEGEHTDQVSFHYWQQLKLIE